MDLIQGRCTDGATSAHFDPHGGQVLVQQGRGGMLREDVQRVAAPQDLLVGESPRGSNLLDQQGLGSSVPDLAPYRWAMPSAALESAYTSPIASTPMS